MVGGNYSLQNWTWWGMWGLWKGLWIIPVIFALSLLLGKWYTTSLISEGLLQAAWCCMWFSLPFARPSCWFFFLVLGCFFLFFFSTYTPGSLKNNFISLSLWVLELSGNFLKCVTAKIVKNLRYAVKDLLQKSYQENKQSNTVLVSLYLSVFLSVYHSHGAVVRIIART